jgi:hypothetical protein
VVHYRGANDTPEPDYNDIGFFWKLCHYYPPITAGRYRPNFKIYLNKQPSLAFVFRP